MGETTMVLAWMGIGVAAAVVAMIMPYKRGWSGLATNLIAGVAGALVFGYLGLAMRAYTHTAAPVSYAWALVGALGTLAAAHAVWHRTAEGRT